MMAPIPVFSAPAVLGTLMRRLALLVLPLALAACAHSSGPAAGTPFFVALGDAPYSRAQVQVLDDTIAEINAARPAFVVHVGDITAGQGPCDDAWLQARARQFDRIEAPFVLLPGDNEWTDCHRGGFDPLERLAAWRRLFHAKDPALRDFSRQSADPRFAEYREHVRWTAGRTLFVGLNVPGSNNNLGRTPAMDAEHAQRMFAVFDWLDEAFKLAESRQMQAVVLFMQANPGVDDRARPRAGKEDGYAALRRVLVEQARWFGRTVVLVHGDTHSFRLDRPMPEAPNLQRIETDGWPHTGWLRIGLPDAAGAPGVHDTVHVQRHLQR